MMNNNDYLILIQRIKNLYDKEIELNHFYGKDITKINNFIQQLQIKWVNESLYYIKKSLELFYTDKILDQYINENILSVDELYIALNNLNKVKELYVFSDNDMINEIENYFLNIDKLLQNDKYSIIYKEMTRFIHQTMYFVSFIKIWFGQTISRKNQKPITIFEFFNIEAGLIYYNKIDKLKSFKKAIYCLEDYINNVGIKKEEALNVIYIDLCRYIYNKLINNEEIEWFKGQEKQVVAHLEKINFYFTTKDNNQVTWDYNKIRLFKIKIYLRGLKKNKFSRKYFVSYKFCKKKSSL